MEVQVRTGPLEDPPNVRSPARRWWAAIGGEGLDQADSAGKGDASFPPRSRLHVCGVGELEGHVHEVAGRPSLVVAVPGRGLPARGRSVSLLESVAGFQAPLRCQLLGHFLRGRQ